LTFTERHLTEGALFLIGDMSFDSYPLFLAQLVNSKKYSDLKLVCQGEEFKVHKAIVCMQSPVLAAACDDVFQVNLAESLGELGLTMIFYWRAGSSDQHHRYRRVRCWDRQAHGPVPVHQGL
jgi:hypothetical protein